MLLRMHQISKSYGPVTANDQVSIELHKGEILAIVGENGAGKSTLMKILYGLEQPDSGTICLNDRQVVFHRPSDAMAQGIGMVQQHFMLFGSMTVAENVVYRKETRKGLFMDHRRNQALVRELSQRYHLPVDPQAVVDDCPVGLQQRIEILKILYQDAHIIIFDEPSAVLTPLEVEDLLKTMDQLSRLGKSIILITHKLHEVMAVAHRVVVMRDGRVISASDTSETSLEKMSYEMVGRQIPTRRMTPPAVGNPLLEVAGLSLKGEPGTITLHDIHLQLRQGEIVGIAGVSGNGQSELIRCLAGLQAYDAGQVMLNGTDVTRASAGTIREAGLAHIPEDRYAWGSAPAATLAENALVGAEGRPPFSRRGILNLRQVNAHAAHLIQGYGVKAASLFQQMASLSGGNAQKLIAAREIARKTPVLIACEPTRGIDIGAMEYIHGQLIEKRDQGDGVLLVSSELSEIMDLCDRIYVMFEGRLNGEFIRGEVDEKTLGLYMLGGNRHAPQTALG
ncbi:ABC transporter ATP-binding protein [Anoxynatronum buryatiense]|uniref:Nucleoside ABC transporter ATP-binding protein n=1 Tax=Anoxynatronum buryatiense TaxID=489973 RepID=A0AA45WV93_9CLOT|nr:ABC transporter ATP-binding protein [Anoxynatronum buryatiense]SMP52311.1 nucleoside ABC transporter ATP-binding protein [Anoxynatronum buryatiense]